LSLIIVEQNIENVIDLTDRMYLVEQGSVVAEGPGQELLSNDQIRQVYFG
jgi:branched-chain amino acid transport system ATP-binding protein